MSSLPPRPPSIPIPAPVSAPVPTRAAQSHVKAHALAQLGTAFGIYALEALTLWLHAAVTHSIAVPAGVLAILVVLAPAMTAAIGFLAHALQTGDFSPPAA